MLLKHRHPGIDSGSLTRRAGFEHLEHNALAVLRWLNAHKIDYVLVGPVAHALRGDRSARGPVTIVPAPYGRNYERLARALTAERAALRPDRGLLGPAADHVPVKLTGEKLAAGRRWMLRFGEFDLDVEVAAGRGGRAAGGGEAGEAGGAGGAAGAGDAGTAAVGGTEAVPAGPRYQELLYETNRLEPADGLRVEVAALEDLEHFSQVRRTGSVPEFRVTRIGEPEGAVGPRAEQDPHGGADAGEAQAEGSDALRERGGND